MKETILDNKCKPGHARGRRGRTAALIATVAICACTAVRLDAVVIDDFEGPVKFAEGGGGTNYFMWGLTNGQLVVSRQNPIPTPSSDVGATYDNVYWPTSLPGVSLEGGRTLELRMDLNHTSADDLFLLLMCGGPDGEDSAYGVIRRSERSRLDEVWPLCGTDHLLLGHSGDHERERHRSSSRSPKRTAPWRSP